ncbi:MAG: type I phosphomannose isomerase catalytic subunit [Bacteroidota bacterium]
MSSPSLYPLNFQPIFKEKIWGGEKIRTILKKEFSPLDNCGETWELSGVQGNISVVKNGPLKGKPLTDLIHVYQEDLLGDHVWEKFGTDFPLLVKFIDANQDLSIQVHPNEELAQKRHHSHGKTEMWYIFQADEDASLIAGFNQQLDRESYQKYFEEGRLLDILNRESVSAGDVFFLPAGRVHTIGKGLLLAEIQQTSDITYRIYDFDRKDADGNRRELHVEQALDAIDYDYYEEYKTPYEPKINESVELVKSPYFSTFRLEARKTIVRDYSHLKSFVILVCVGGEAQGWIEGAGKPFDMKLGDVYLIPAALPGFRLKPRQSCTLLEAWVPA